MEKITNWEKALIDEIDDILHDNYDDYESGISLNDTTKLKIAEDFCQTFDFEDLRLHLMDLINKELRERLNYLRSKANIMTLDELEYEDLDILNTWERGDL